MLSRKGKGGGKEVRDGEEEVRGMADYMLSV